MNVLGVDPSLTCTGMAKVVDGVVEVRRVNTGPAETLLGTRLRIRTIVRDVLAFAPERCLVVIESPALALKGRSALFVERCWLFGLLVDQLHGRGRVVAVTPAGRAKYATGRGNAKKVEVLAQMRDVFSELFVVDDNVADALALAGMGARFLGFPIDGDVTAKQMDAMAAVAWPERKKEANE